MFCCWSQVKQRSSLSLNNCSACSPSNHLWNSHVILMENEGTVKVTNYALKLLLQVKMIHPLLQVKVNILLLFFALFLLSLCLIFASISDWRKALAVQFFSLGLGLLLLCNGEAKPSKILVSNTALSCSLKKEVRSLFLSSALTIESLQHAPLKNNSTFK